LVKRVPFALAISIWALCVLAQDGVETFDAKRFEAFRDHAFAREADRDWMKIAWQPDMDAGLEAARSRKSPSSSCSWWDTGASGASQSVDWAGE
jgi:hypothetical protein